MFKHDRHWIINFGILLLCFKIAKTQNAPQIPCPDIFKYISSRDNYIGEVTLNKLTLKNITVEIAFIQRESITSNYYGRLSLNRDLQTTHKNLEDGTPISYRVDFPSPDILPKLIFIKVNGDTICSGEGLDAPSTTFTLRHTFYPKGSTTTSAKTDPNTTDTPIILPSKPNTIFTPPRITNAENSFLPNNPFIRKHLDDLTSNPSTVYKIPLTQPVDIPAKKPPQTISVTGAPVNTPTNKPPVNTRMNTPPVNITVNSSPQTMLTNRRPANVPENGPSGQFGNIGCGREGLTPFVAQGYDFPRGKFPWLAAIYLRDSADLKFTCGGSLISSRTVITAAHCFPTPNFSPDLIIVYLGRHNLFISEDGSQQRDVASLTMHPNYNISAISDADIALLHFTFEVTFSRYIRPVCLWTQSAELSFIEEQKGFIAGWGSDNNGNAVTSVAKMVEAKIVSEADCLRSSDLFRILTSSRSLCAGNRDGSGPCIGDSGGGLMLNVFGVWTLRGILSVGKTVQRNCDLNEFVVYCDVAKHMSWVRQNMN